MTYLIPPIALALGYLDIDGIPLDTAGWTTTNINDLFASPPLRGSDVLYPGAQGQRAMPRRRNIAKATIELVVEGHYRWDGTAHSNPNAGLLINERHLLQNVAAIPATADSTRVMTFHLPSTGYELDPTWIATIHVEQLRFVRNGIASATGQLEISIPVGGLSGVWSF